MASETFNPTVIAKREYKSSTGLVVIAIVFLPLKEEAGDWRCGYQCTGAVDSAGYAMGLDAIEAIDTCLWMLGSELKRLDETTFSNTLTWIGSDDDHRIGLPFINSTEPNFKPY